eukprot:CAMPEP_0117488528 /NCGR_PEP_ID=MMETSP0784-20121206/16562_1 /TAXON_ID=39447 /ORGANISM="" /LENGTH=146 /DNA_ID=CAMNT_0005283219 /DNA_START=332 /DNA_END=773 /DNA_ORIENTATION=-
MVKFKEESKTGKYHTDCAEECRSKVEGKLQNSRGILLGRLNDNPFGKAATGDLKAIHQSSMADCDRYIAVSGKGPSRPHGAMDCDRGPSRPRRGGVLEHIHLLSEADVMADSRSWISQAVLRVASGSCPPDCAAMATARVDDASTI